ncbi:MAG TPA: ABC transporter permease [Kofleriaceae bacterium]|nr:ABC transporter permease [Kofleriaceae bacterium]
MFLATVKKELQLLRRDPRALVRLLALPVAFIALFGMVFRHAEHGPTGRPLAIYVAPDSQLGATVVAALSHSTMFRPVALASAEEVRAKVAAEAFDAGLILPRDFDPAHGGAKAELVIDTDKALAERGPIQGAVVAIVDAVVMGPRAETVAIVSPRQQPHETPDSFQMTVPGNAVLFGFFIALTCALSFAEERRTGTWRRLLAAPVSRWKLLTAKLVPYVALGTLQVLLLFAIGVFGFGMQINGSIAALAVLTVGVAASATGLGLLLASVSSTEKQISSLGSVAILIMGLVGGCMLPRVLMPHLMQQIGLFVPHGWALDGYNALLVRHGTGFADVIKPIAAVYGFAALFMFVGIRRFRFDA